MTSAEATKLRPHDSVRNYAIIGDPDNAWDRDRGRQIAALWTDFAETSIRLHVSKEVRETWTATAPPNSGCTGF